MKTRPCTKKLIYQWVKKKISLNEQKKKLFPILREDGTTLYYEILDDGIYRVGKKFLKEKNIKTESKKDGVTYSIDA